MLQRIIHILFIVILFLLPFGLKMINFLTILLPVLLVVNVFVSGRIESIRNSGLLVLPAIFILSLISLTYSENIGYGINLLGRRLTFILIPLSFYFGGFKRSWVNDALKFYIHGVFVSFILCSLTALISSLHIENGQLLFNASVLHDYTLGFSESIHKGGNYFFYTSYSVFMHPTYASLHVLIALSFLLFSKTSLYSTKLLKALYLPSLILFLILLSSRAALITLFAVLLFYGLKLILEKNSISKKVGIVAVLVIAFGLGIKHPRTKVAIYNLKNNLELKNEGYLSSFNIRMLTYNAALNVIKDSPFWGYGIGDSEDVLLREYKKLEYHRNYEEMLNAHNQFFQVLIESGILLGLIPLIYFIVLLIILALRSGKYDFAMIIFIYIGNLTFESIFNRDIGVIPFVLFICCLLMISDDFFSKKNVIIN